MQTAKRSKLVGKTCLFTRNLLLQRFKLNIFVYINKLLDFCILSIITFFQLWMLPSQIIRQKEIKNFWFHIMVQRWSHILDFVSTIVCLHLLLLILVTLRYYATFESLLYKLYACFQKTTICIGLPAEQIFPVNI